MKRFAAVLAISASAFLATLSFAQQLTVPMANGHKLTIPESSIPRSGRMTTQYALVDSTARTLQPPPGSETPGSVACVYELVSGPPGCPISTSTNVPTGGVGAIALVDAGYYPTAASDLAAFSTQFGLPQADFTVVYANGTQPPVYSDWIIEEALDIEWAHAMAPNAKLFLVESDQLNTDPTWQAVEVAGKLVAENGGGVVSMSWGIPEWPGELGSDKYFTAPGVVYFAGSGDFGLGVSFHPASSPNVVAVGGTLFNRDPNGNFVSESYATGEGGGDLSPFEPIPSYQSVISSIVGTHRGFPDVAADFCCAAIYQQGWTSVAGTSWATPTFAGIVNAAGHLAKSSHQELTAIYNEYTTPTFYQTEFYDITAGDPHCVAGWDFCSGVGSPRTYKGK